MEKLYLIIFFIFGSIMGSFYHVIATRLSNGLSIVKPASHCEKCKHQLKWYELIPIISYLMQFGKCRKCKTKLPLSYFLIELCTGILFAVCYHVFDTPLEIAISIIFVSSLVIIIISDIEYMIILDEVLIVAILSIIVLDIIDIGLYQTSIKILYGAGSFITMLLIKKLGDIIFKQESLGGGDIKLMFLIGLVIGYEMAICNIFFATFIAFPIALFLLISKKDNIIPFGPFLSMSAIILYIWGINFTDIINFIIS
ncbi:MAG: prepilin peptidase [Bacilli bacterium]|nr:prepilin peptidase [Bacilli bacterium]